MCLKRLKISAFGSSKPLLFLRLIMGMSAPSLHIESTDSVIEARLCIDYTFDDTLIELI